MTNKNEKYLALFACAGYLIFEVIVLAGGKTLVQMSAHSSVSTLQSMSFSILFFLSLTILPWLTARYAARRWSIVSLREISLLAFSVSSFGMAVAEFSQYFLGNHPGIDCYFVTILHGLIIAIAATTFYFGARFINATAVLLRICGFLYYCNILVLNAFESMSNCGPTPNCHDEGWKIFGLNLLDYSEIISALMAFIILSLVTKSLNKEPPTPKIRGQLS